MDKEKSKELLFDQRLCTRFIKRRIISLEEYQAYLDALPDREENILKVEVLGDDLPSMKKGANNADDLDNPPADD